MTYTVNDPQTFYAAIVGRLATNTSLPVGEGKKPDGVTLTDDKLPSSPYFVIYPLDDQETFGTLADPDSDVWWLWQITCVAGRQDQAQVGQRLARAALIGWAPVVAGLTCSKVELESGSGVGRDDDVNPPLFFSTDRFRAFSSPA